MTAARRALMERQFALIGVLVPEALLGKMDEARGDLDRDEWCVAAFESYLTRTDVVARYAKTLRRQRRSQTTAALRRMM